MVGDDALERAAARMAPLLSEQAALIDAKRCLTDPVISALHKAGMFRTLLPVALGGQATGLPVFCRTVQALAAADASTAWCVAQSAVIATSSLWLEDDVLSAMWQDPHAALANGPPLDAKLAAAPEGYLLTGRWGFSSGCQHATWMTGAVQLADDTDDPGAWRVAFWPQAQTTFHDTWKVQGLRGTGSFEFSLPGLQLPSYYVADLRRPARVDLPVVRIPLGLVFAAAFAAVALGVARAALNDALAVGSDKTPIYSGSALRDDPEAQARAGRAEARWRAANAYLYESVEAVWQAVTGHERANEEHRVALRLAGTHVMREAAAVLDAAYMLVGSSGIYRQHPIHRRFQDMHVVTQHVQARMNHFQTAGAFLLGNAFRPGVMI